MPRSQSCRRLPLLGLVALLATACSSYDGLRFATDKRLSYVTPAARAMVSVPLTIRWTMADFGATGLDGSSDPDQGVFAVFVDTSPMPVGDNLAWLGRNDASCRRDPRCPTASYLADRGVYLTTDTSVELMRLPTVADGVGDEQHGVTVVLLDGTGKRRSESNWYRPFTSKRRPTS